ncbi:MAG: polynucleotide adenylyltransferase PcnB, partial [Ottowia sp.]|nr:polynucleotide adenylyltransferase PcnB [Ottowia sp.]
DFLLLRCQSGELPEALGIWWTQFQSVDMPAREEMLTALRETTGSGAKPARTRRSRRKVTHDNAKPVELE